MTVGSLWFIRNKWRFARTSATPLRDRASRYPLAHTAALHDAAGPIDSARTASGSPGWPGRDGGRPRRPAPALARPARRVLDAGRRRPAGSRPPRRPRLRGRGRQLDPPRRRTPRLALRPDPPPAAGQRIPGARLRPGAASHPAGGATRRSLRPANTTVRRRPAPRPGLPEPRVPPRLPRQHRRPTLAAADGVL